MTNHAWTLLVAFSAVLLLLALPLGRFIASVMEGRLAFAVRVEGPLYRLCGVKPDAEMGWLPYTLALLLFNGIGLVAVYALQRLQLWLPLNPQGLANVSPDSALNTAISFATNTNWQSYSGEATMSQFSQMVGLTIHNFTSAATGIALAFAFI
ncbi:MAG: potassium-transporting ATPase subunit KdpA, partial [Caldimonas sp.]